MGDDPSRQAPPRANLVDGVLDREAPLPQVAPADATRLPPRPVRAAARRRAQLEPGETRRHRQDARRRLSTRHGEP